MVEVERLGCGRSTLFRVLAVFVMTRTRNGPNIDNKDEYNRYGVSDVFHFVFFAYALSLAGIIFLDNDL